MTELRDLEEDRQFLQRYPFTRTETERNLHRIAESALREIAQLKKLIVFEVKLMVGGGVVWRNLIDDEDHPTEADAWAAVRKAALK